MFYGGEILGNTYQIIREIGNGGTGVIYLAWHLRLEQEVVVKKIFDDVAGNINVRAEVDILKGLRHTGLPRVYDYLQIDRQIYTVMEYIRGYDLQAYIDRGAGFSEKQLRKWLLQLCQVLEYLHTRKPKILHSDIKPANIMITQEGNVCLIDFNISLDGRNNKDIKGLSRYFAAPEQLYKASLIQQGRDASGVTLDERMDIYSLGATFYQLMTGRYPEAAPKRQYPVEKLDIPYSEALKSVVGKAMAWEPGERYLSAKAMYRAVMNTSGPAYRRLQMANVLACVCCAGLFIVGVWNAVCGWNGMAEEAYRHAFDRYEKVCERYDNEKIIDKGLELLNEDKYKRFLDSDEEEKAWILNQMGDACFDEESYDQAERYYERAAGAMPDYGLYYRNQAIALARSGNSEKAKRILQKAEERGVRENLLKLAEQEIAFCESSYEEAAALGEQLKSAPEQEIAGRSCLITAKAYEQIKNTEKQKEFLELACQVDGGVRCLRELGNCCLELGRNNSADTREYLEKGEECFRKLWESPYAAETDGLNLAVALQLSGRPDESMEILKKLEEQDTKYYQVYMYMAYISIQKNRENHTKADLNAAKRWYRTAEQLYRESDKQDESMELLKEAIRQQETAQREES